MVIFPAYEFLVGLLFFRWRNKPLAWIYTGYEEGSYRQISAFSRTYFVAWWILGVLHGLILELIFTPGI